METQVELTSRLSAFDSFLFFAEAEQEIQHKDLLKDNRETKNASTLTPSASDVIAKPTPKNQDENSIEKEMKIDMEYGGTVHESNVRLVPGSSEEREEMVCRLSAFDDYMFLLDGAVAKTGVGVAVAAAAAAKNGAISTGQTTSQKMAESKPK